MDFALCRTLDFLASLINAFFFVHDSENPKFGSFSLNSRQILIIIIILSMHAKDKQHYVVLIESYYKCACRLVYLIAL